MLFKGSWWISVPRRLWTYFVLSALVNSAVRGTITGDLQSPITNRNSSLENFTVCPLRSKYMNSALLFSTCTSLNRMWWTNGLLNTMFISTSFPKMVLLNISSYLYVSFSLITRFKTPIWDEKLVAWVRKQSSAAILKLVIFEDKQEIIVWSCEGEARRVGRWRADRLMVLVNRSSVRKENWER